MDSNADSATLASAFAVWERRILLSPMKAFALGLGLCALELGLWSWNRAQGKSVELDFEDAEPDLMVTLGLGPV